MADDQLTPRQEQLLKTAQGIQPGATQLPADLNTALEEPSKLLSEWAKESAQNFSAAVAAPPTAPPTALEIEKESRNNRVWAIAALASVGFLGLSFYGIFSDNVWIWSIAPLGFILSLLVYPLCSKSGFVINLFRIVVFCITFFWVGAWVIFCFGPVKPQ